MPVRIALAALIVVAVIGCSSDRYCAAPARNATLDQLRAANARAAYAALRSPDGPTRFAQVTPQLYRGGQPSRDQLALLRDLGVRTVINLRDTPGAVASERAQAEALGLTFRNFPFSGLSRPDPDQLRAIVAAMQQPGDGAVYVHCHQGRDRTSLVVALYRVWVDHWDAQTAWQREADDFGHGGWRHVFFRKLDQAFVALTRT
jgi:protein tyrosine/serine phosphatase